MSQTPTERRVHPPREHDKNGVLEAITDELGLFGTRQKAMMFAAGLGYQLKRREPVAEWSSNAIRYDIFQRAVDDGFIDALAVAETKDLNVLAENRLGERIQIFEEYAHAGLIEIQSILDEPTDSLDGLIRAVQDARETAPAEFSGMDPAVLGMMVEGL